MSTIKKHASGYLKLIERYNQYDIDVPFKFTYKTSCSQYVAEFNGSTYINCQRNDDGTLVILFENHQLLGNVRVIREFFVPDTDCEGGIFHAVSCDNIDLCFTDGITDDSEVNIDVILPYARGLKGDPGAAFTYADFTPEQLAALKVKGDPFTYTDFTPEQLAALKGEPGNDADIEGANKVIEDGKATIEAMSNLGTQLGQAEASRVVAEQGREAAEVIREQKIAEMDKTYATKVELKALEDIVIQGADAYWYGCESPIGQADPDMTRIGYMDNHRTLPYHNRIRPCVVNDDRTINYFLDNNDIRLKADGTASKLDGTDGQLMVYYPAGYHILNRGLTKEVWAVGLSPFSYDGIAAEYVPAFIVSMDYATVQRTGNKLACVINEDADYAGSGSGATAGGLGYPRTAVSNYNYTLYARNRGAEWVNSFAFFELIKTSLMYIEYSTHYLQKPFNLALTSQGYKQGGLGEGAWNWSGTNWSAYNGYYPVIKIGEVQLDLSQSASTNGTGVYTRVFQIGETQYTTKFPCWRWCSNLYAHLWRWDAGVDIDIHPDTSGTPISAVYMTKNPSEVLATNDNDFSFIELYDKIGELPRVGSYSKEFHKGSAYQKIGSAGSNTYMCAYFWTTIGAGRERRGFLSGGLLHYGGNALRASAYSNNRPSATTASVGSGLSAYVVE